MPDIPPLPEGYKLDNQELPPLPPGYTLDGAEKPKPKTKLESVMRSLGLLSLNPGSLMTGAGETALQMGTGAAGAIAGGLRGIGASIVPGGMTGPEAVQQTQEAMTYQPRTEAGQVVSEVVNKPFEWLEQKADYIGEVSGEPTDTLGATLVKTGILGAPAILGLRGRSPAPRPTPQQAILRQANEEGYVAPPSSVSRSGTVSDIEGMGGKVKTQQMASVRNQDVTNRLAARSLGLPEETVLSSEVTAQVRASASPIYQQVRSVGEVELGTPFKTSVESAVREFRNTQGELPTIGNSTILKIADDLKKNSLDSGVLVDAIELLRERANVAYRAGEAKTGRAYRSMSSALEDALEAQLAKSGNAQLLQEFRNARQLIAQSYTIENALKGSNIDAHLLAQQLNRGKPFTGDIRAIAEFAQNFPKASRLLNESVPMYSPLDVAYQLGSAAAAVGTGNLSLAVPAAYSLARPAIRNYLLSQRGQALAQPGPNALSLSPVGVGASALLNDEEPISP